MDPQKNPQTPTQDDAGQQPASIQMPQDSAPSPEVTVDFNQDTPGATPGMAQSNTGAGGSPTAGFDSGFGVPAAGQNAGGAFDDSLGTPQPSVTDTQTNTNVPPAGPATDLGLGGSVESQPAPVPTQPPADSYAPPSTQSAAGFPPDTGVPAGQSFNPADQSAVPPVAPVPASKADKKTVMILAAVAVILIIAIAVLFFM